MADLPVADATVVAHLEHEAARIATTKPEEAFSAKLRLAWALAHSEKGQADYARAKAMTSEMLARAEEREGTGDPEATREVAQSIQELLYLKAVASFNLDDLVTAHLTVTQLLERCPHSHQGLALKERINSEILRKGLTGIGILAGVATIGATLLMKLASKK